VIQQRRCAQMADAKALQKLFLLIRQLWVHVYTGCASTAQITSGRRSLSVAETRPLREIKSLQSHSTPAVARDHTR
jgi:hypothetical protein